MANVSSVGKHASVFVSEGHSYVTVADRRRGCGRRKNPAEPSKHQSASSPGEGTDHGPATKPLDALLSKCGSLGRTRRIGLSSSAQDTHQQTAGGTRHHRHAEGVHTLPTPNDSFLFVEQPAHNKRIDRHRNSYQSTGREAASDSPSRNGVCRWQ